MLIPSHRRLSIYTQHAIPLCPPAVPKLARLAQELGPRPVDLGGPVESPSEWRPWKLRLRPRPGARPRPPDRAAVMAPPRGVRGGGGDRRRDRQEVRVNCPSDQLFCSSTAARASENGTQDEIWILNSVIFCMSCHCVVPSANNDDHKAFLGIGSGTRPPSTLFLAYAVVDMNELFNPLLCCKKSLKLCQLLA